MSRVDFSGLVHSLFGCYCLMKAYLLIGLILGTGRWKMKRLDSNVATFFAF